MYNTLNALKKKIYLLLFRFLNGNHGPRLQPLLYIDSGSPVVINTIYMLAQHNKYFW